ncbi:hypothetical protein quinque_002425 [Culex quinquefasciatus]
MDLDSAVDYRMLKDAIEFVSQILTTGILGVEPLLRCWIRVSVLATISGTLFWSILPLRSLRAEILTGHTQSTTQLGQSVDGTLKFYLYGQEVT